jgi:mxaD protein
MKRLLIFLMLALASSATANACGPTPQKVSKEITIHASPDKVWAEIKDFGNVGTWNPLVMRAVVKQVNGEESKPTLYRELTLQDGGKMLEKLRETPDDEMKQDIRIEETTLPVSNYRGVMTVNATANANESVVTWIGRFNNKANLMDAPVGQDNATAVAAISNFYELGLAALKKKLESQ